MLPIVLVPMALGALAVIGWQKWKARPWQEQKLGPLEAVSGNGAPTALQMLAFCIRNGQTPPPIVVQTALAEATATGQRDVAEMIVARFVAPVVAAAKNGNADASVRAAEAPAAAAPTPTSAGSDLPSAADIDALCASSPPYAPPQTSVGRVIDGVDADAWQAFVGKLDREDPGFATERHVGRFRQRRERLAELGIAAPATPDEQARALERDLADAYAHARAAGMLDELVGTAVKVDGVERGVTPSGVLGVIQAAGLDGAYSWFTSPADRSRFPHTTKQFLATNGVF